HANYGGLAFRQKWLDDAMKAYRAASALNPREALYFVMMGAIFGAQGRHEDSLACSRRALELAPDRSDFYDCMLYDLWFCPNLDRQQILDEHQRWADRFAVPLAQNIAPHENDPSPDRRLRIGYVSSDLRFNVVGFFMQPILESHDPQAVEVFVYFGGQRDAMSERLAAPVHHWRDVQG